MSRIKGKYTARGRMNADGKLIGEVRWLDVAKGKTYGDETANRCMGTGFERTAESSYGNGWYVFTPDAVAPAHNWYVLMLPAKVVHGPFPESHARRVAAQRADANSGTYAVVQVLPGNTAEHAPPVPPVPNVVWS